MGVYYPIINGLSRAEIQSKVNFDVYFDNPISSFKIEWRFLTMNQNMQFALKGYSLAWPVDTGYGIGQEFSIASVTPATLGNGTLATYTLSQPTRHVRLTMTLSGDDQGAGYEHWAILHPVS